MRQVASASCSSLVWEGMWAMAIWKPSGQSAVGSRYFRARFTANPLKPPIGIAPAERSDAWDRLVHLVFWRRA